MATSYVWVRQQWLFEYMGDNFYQIIENRDAFLSTNLKEGYKMHLEDRHPWLLSKTVILGMLSCTTKENFEANYCEP